MAGGRVDDERARGADGARHGALQALIKEPANDVLDLGTMWQGGRGRHGAQFVRKGLGRLTEFCRTLRVL